LSDLSEISPPLLVQPPRSVTLRGKGDGASEVAASQKMESHLTNRRPGDIIWIPLSKQ